MRECEIAVVGAGTTGLAAALFLAEDRHAVTVFERFDTPQPVGAGLMLQPTGLACLATLGLDREIIEQSRVVNRIEGRTTSGRLIMDIGYAAIGPSLFGLGVHRATLFGALYDTVQQKGLPVITAARIETSEVQSEGRWLTDEAGRRFGPFDLVIDASGARSALRAAHGDVRRVTPFPYAALWGVCAEPADWQWPNVLVQRYHSARHMLGVLPLGQRRGADTPEMAFFWSLRADAYDAWCDRGLAAWHDEIDQYWPAVSDLARSFQSADDLTFATYDDVVMRRVFADRILFLGDAAHATSPQLGQGANLGLADALVFREALRRAQTLAEALAEYARSRAAHVRFYQWASRGLTPLFQSDSRVAGWLRDLTFGPAGRIPFVRNEMVRSLAGIKTGLFSTLDPGDWHQDYAVGAPPRAAAAADAAHS